MYYTHVFTPPDMTMEDVYNLLSQLPTNGGKPSQGTKADKRLTRNKPTTPAKPATMPARKGK